MKAISEGMQEREFSMGGKLIQSAFNLPEKRLGREEYLLLTSKVLNDLDKRFLRLGINISPLLISAYFDKQTFGDADILCQKFNIGGLSYSEVLFDLFGEKPFCNGGVYSLPIEGFQFDFITVSKDIYDTAYDYFIFSPQGNAVGKIAHTFGLRYGHAGLYFVIREQNVGGQSTENSHVLEEVILTRNTREIHEFLGLDHFRFLRGFDELEDIFEWVCSTKYFHPSRFSFEEMNYRARTRDRKRSDYNALMAWIEQNKARLPAYQRKENKADYIPWICESFPILKERLDYNRIVYKETQEIKTKFNGHIIKEMGIFKDGEEEKMGRAIAAYKKSKRDFRKFVLDTKKERVMMDFIDFVNGCDNI